MFPAAYAAGLDALNQLNTVLSAYNCGGGMYATAHDPVSGRFTAGPGGSADPDRGWGAAGFPSSPQGPAAPPPASRPPPPPPAPAPRVAGPDRGWGAAGFPGTPQGNPSGGGVPERGWGGLGEVWNTLKDTFGNWSQFAAQQAPAGYGWKDEGWETPEERRARVLGLGPYPADTGRVDGPFRGVPDWANATGDPFRAVNGPRGDDREAVDKFSAAGYGGYGAPVLPSGMTPEEDEYYRRTGFRPQVGYGGQPSDRADVSPAKAREILSDGTVHGHPLTDAQRGMFGAVAGHGTHNAGYAAPRRPADDSRNRYSSDPRNRPPAVYAPAPHRYDGDDDGRWKGPGQDKPKKKEDRRPGGFLGDVAQAGKEFIDQTPAWNWQILSELGNLAAGLFGGR